MPSLPATTLIDIDGNDYYVWQAINSVPHQSDWQGASLKSLELLGRELGYQLAGINLRGVNAFFVRQDLAGDKFITSATAETLYNPFPSPHKKLPPIFMGGVFVGGPVRH